MMRALGMSNADRRGSGSLEGEDRKASRRLICRVSGVSLGRPTRVQGHGKGGLRWMDVGW